MIKTSCALTLFLIIMHLDLLDFSQVQKKTGWQIPWLALCRYQHLEHIIQISPYNLRANNT